jgi:hypothetical protein
MSIFDDLKSKAREARDSVRSFISDATVRKGNTQTPSPTSGNSRSPTGKQAKTESTPYEFNDLRFPYNIGGPNKLLHWIKFTPNVQVKSSYNVKKATNASGQQLMGTTDGNRMNLGGQLGSGPDPMGGLDVTAAATLGLGLYGGATKFAESIASGDPTKIATAGFRAAGGFVGGAVVGALAGGIVDAIDLTRKTRRAAATIGLYMPDTVQQTVVNDYDQVSMTQALGLAGLALQAGGTLTEGVVDAAMNGNITFGQTPGSAALGEIAGAAAEKTGVFGQGITDALLFSAGYAQNPQVELLFRTIQNREFLFDFKFAPRNKAEADEVIKIIQTFRFFAAPEIPTSGNGRYFIPPSEFDIQFMVGSNPNTKLPKIATCVLQGIDVNYGSAGQWTAFQDGMPVEIAMQLRFKEVEIMHKELIRNGF